MKARVNSAFEWRKAQVAGLEFVKDEWRPVPAAFENEARRAGFLELDEDLPKPEPTPAPEPPKPARRRKK